MIRWLIGDHVKKEIKDHLHNLHLHLAHSFSNIKEDMSKINFHLKDKDKKLEELERKIQQLEDKLFFAFQLREEPKQISEPEEEYEEDIPNEKPISLIASLTYTQQTILVAIYELQTQLGSPISFKSLAQYLYRDKKYQAVRTTLSEYIDLLTEYGFAKKERIGRETAAIITKKGGKLAKEIIEKDKQKEKLKIKER